MAQTLSRFSGRIIGFLAITFFFLASCSNPDSDIDPNDPDNGNETADMAPAFSLKSLSGSTISLSDFDDQVVVLFFFGHSCPSCKAIGPNVESELNTAFNSRNDYAILGLDQWNGSSASVQSFKDNTGITFPLLLNASGVASEYSTTYDRFIVIDKKGKIVHKGTRVATNDLDTVMKLVEDLLNDM